MELRKVSSFPINVVTGAAESKKSFIKLKPEAEEGQEEEKKTKFELKKKVALAIDTSSPEYQEKLRKVSEEFAGLYIYEVFKKMYNTVPKSGLIPETLGERWFREMLLQQYAMKASKTELKNLADLIYKSLGGKVAKSEESKDRSESLKLLKTLTSMGTLSGNPAGQVGQEDESGK